MLSDRSYLRPLSGRPAPGFLAWFLGGLAGLFVLQQVMEVFFGSYALLDFGALSAVGVRDGKVWTALTYALFHGGVLHLLVNLLALFFVGRYLEETLGPRRLAAVSVAGALGGSAAWLGLHFQGGGAVIGASAVAMCYLTVFACLNPRRPITVLLFFVIPITIQPMWLVAILAGIDVLGLFTRELSGGGAFYGVAHSAHLGGLAAGWLFHRLVLASGRGAGMHVEPPEWLRRRPRVTLVSTPNLSAPRSEPAHSGHSAAPSPASAASLGDLRAEVDRILDKISLHGFGSLSAEEKRVLDEARQQFSAR